MYRWLTERGVFQSQLLVHCLTNPWITFSSKGKHCKLKPLFCFVSLCYWGLIWGLHLWLGKALPLRYTPSPFSKILILFTVYLFWLRVRGHGWSGKTIDPDDLFSATKPPFCSKPRNLVESVIPCASLTCMTWLIVTGVWSRLMVYLHKLNYTGS